jgi:pyruvate,water dikinase
VVQGAVNPDEYFVFKPTLSGFRPILENIPVYKREIKMVYDLGGGVDYSLYRLARTR